MQPPQYPAGPFEKEGPLSAQRREELIAVLESAPAALQKAVAGLSEGQLDTKYKNWTIRQIVHHLPDSHVNAYIRFKCALTEDVPMIKPYDEGRWAALSDSRSGDVRAPLALMAGLHACWIQLLRSMSEEQFTRAFFHPEFNETVSLDAALASYAWHCRHHTGQILWLRKQNGW
jgi:uncharacterized damage-inducible protein DinB